MKFRILRVILASAILSFGQTTEGIITGRITNDTTGRGVTGAKIQAVNGETSAVFEAISLEGAYALVRLPPGIYDISVDAGKSYRPARVERVDLPVAGFIRQNVALRAITDIWQQNLLKSVVARDQRTVLMFYGPDVDVSRSLAVEDASSVRGSLEPAISETATALIIENVPLAGRDAYQLITFMPGAVGGLASLRGAGVSVNGQRPSSSNFLLDGLENNNYLITGPFLPMPPEAVEQYRVSTNNFSAEYGRTSGYIANTVSHSGSNAWHALAYIYAQNEALNANTPERKPGLPKLALREWECGFRLTGPIAKGSVFHSELFEWLSAHTWDDARSYVLPGPAMAAEVTSPESARVLSFRAPAGGVVNNDGSRSVLLRRPHSLGRFTALERVDWEPSGAGRLAGRVLASRQSVPDFIWSPYPDFVSPLAQDNIAAAIAYTRSISQALTVELRAGVNRDLVEWNQPHSDVPSLQIRNTQLKLPGSPVAFVLRNRGIAMEYHGNVIYVHGRHVLKAGGGSITRSIAGRISVLNGIPQLSFEDWAHFTVGMPEAVRLPEARNAYLEGRYESPDMNREYRYIQSVGFLQDSLRVTSRFLVHAGIRYDRFGVPNNVGAAKDWVLQLGPAGDFTERLRNSLVAPPPAGEQPLYAADKNDWAARLGFALNASSKGGLIVRGAYGIYYDRPFDNLWLNLRFNNSLPVTVDTPGVTLTNYSPPALQALAPGSGMNPDWKNYGLTLYQSRIRTPYVQSFFFGIQRRLTDSMLLEVNYAGSEGRKLITTDRVNRPECAAGLDSCRPNPDLRTDVDYRANQGKSSYHSLIATLDLRSKHVQGRLNYAWSHAIDNQSDPLLGLLSSNLEVTNITAGGRISPQSAAFAQQYSNSADRGNADFDQRQSLGGALVASVRNWTLGALGVIRSGSPYSIYASASSYPFFYNRPDLVSKEVEFSPAPPYPGGKRLLNTNAFTDPPTGRLGNVGRNAFSGPGFYSLDLSLSRQFTVAVRDRPAHVQLRVDAYNVMNHANAINPNVNDGSAFLPVTPSQLSNFAVASYTRRAETAGPLSFLPLAESSRQLQLMLRFTF